MTEQRGWSTFHPSAFRHAAAPMRRVAAIARPYGAIRYRCPLTGSFVLVTDDAMLSRLTRPSARLRCADCGDVHLLTLDDADAFPAIVAATAKP